MSISKIKNKKVNWKNEPYVWMMIFFPVLAIIGGIITTYLAIKSNDGLVVDDYYKEGLEINRTIERDQIALEFNLDAEISFDEELEEVIVKLNAEPDFVYPNDLSATFLNATRAGLDEKANLILINKNSYRGNVPKLTTGKWYVHLQRDDWRLIEIIHIKN